MASRRRSAGVKRGNRQLLSGNRTLQWLYVEDKTLPHREQQLLEALQGRRLDPPLDPADRVLAGPRAHREPSLAEPLPQSRIPEYISQIPCSLTPHTVSSVKEIREGLGARSAADASRRVRPQGPGA